MDLEPYLELMVEKNASDLFLTSRAPIKLKMKGRLVSVGKTELTPEVVREVAYKTMDDRTRARFDEDWVADYAISLPDNRGRFRVNTFTQRGEVAMVLRYIPSNVPTVDEMALPEVLKDIIVAKRGLVLVVGSTGSGKSTTIAAMIDHRNEEQSGHILTIEDPVEYYHPNKRSIVNQREVGMDTPTYASALRAAMREAPNVILIGEIRDMETLQSALELANTGHLCVSTMHANNANQAMDRCANLFPSRLHRQLFLDLSTNFQGIISQRLVPDLQGNQVAAMEILVRTPLVCDKIREGAFGEIKKIMIDSGAKGMLTFDESLFRLYKDGSISLDEALNNADSRTNLEARINFA